MSIEIPTMRGLLVIAAVAAAACGDPSSEGPAAADDVPVDSGVTAEASGGEWVPTPTEIERATELGRDAAGRLAGILVQNLSAQMQAGGAESAIEFCSGEAMTLTRAVNVELGGLEVKRTSIRVRNPENAPDALERVALSYFEKEMDAGSLPEHWVQAAGDEELRYYQPLLVREMCTQCHGPTDTLDPAVRKRLEELYPEDRAVGYAPGDFRGLIRVAIPREALGER